MLHDGVHRLLLSCPRCGCFGCAARLCSITSCIKPRIHLLAPSSTFKHSKMFETPRHRKQAEAFDSIDTLRHAQLSPRIDTPQIVICGDHSSDKDSLIEALTRLPYPKGSWDMQRCATELVMRHAAKPRVQASIRPDSSRELADVIHLQEFKYSSQVTSHVETLRLFRRAIGHLEQLQSASGYWYDTLRIEISGPSQSPLTLIVSPTRVHTLSNHDIDVW
jgi:hypothetical protein